MLYKVIEDAFKRLENLPQRTDYHPEKWVWDHEAYVLDGVGYVQQAGLLTDRQFKELQLVALFHDMGKLSTTKRHEKKGHLVSYGHAKRSVKWWEAVSEFVTAQGGPWESARPEVVKFIIAQHMRINSFDDMRQSKKDAMLDEAGALGPKVFSMLKAFNHCDNMLDYMDTTTERERESAKREFEEIVNLVIDRIERASNNASPGQGARTLWVMRGAPGSGKSTVARTLADKLEGETSERSADAFFEDEDGNYNFERGKHNEAHAECRENVEEDMLYGIENIFVHNTNTQAWEFVSFYSLAAKHGYLVNSIVVENRHGSKDVHDVPPNKVEQMRDRFEVKL